MKRFLFCVALFAMTIEAFPNVFQFEIPHDNASPKHYKDAKTSKNNGKSSASAGRNLKAFSWKDCGSSSALTSIKSLSLTPDPLAFPGPLNVAAQFIIKSSLETPLKGELKVYKKELGVYIEIPCIDNFGSCTYDDVCSLLSQITQCPDPLIKIGIQCSCPFKANSYTLPKTEFDLNASVIPSGDYHIVANVLAGNGTQAACVDIFIEID